MKKLLFVFIIAPILNGQDISYNNNNGLQYGFSAKAAIEINVSRNSYKPSITYRLSAGVGVGTTVINESFYPTLNADVQFYRGGLGSGNEFDRSGKTNLDIVVAATVTAGCEYQYKKSKINNITLRNVPLYYFSDFSPTNLQNPYEYSFSLGTNFIFTTDRNKKTQQVGFLNFNVFDGVQLSYYNDGIPFQYISLGDGSDRYYSGGALLSINTRNKDVNLAEFSFHKYTGYSKDAFELSSELQLAHVNYKDKNQEKYNKSVFRFNLTSNKNYLSLGGSYFNYEELDLQNLIHWMRFLSYHVVPYKPHNTLNAAVIYTNSSIGVDDEE